MGWGGKSRKDDGVREARDREEAEGSTHVKYLVLVP
jgi:hypothetical protein